MKSFDTETRTAAALRQRLLAGPEEMRAIATAETADWERPDFAIDAEQQEAMEAMLRACGDARAAVLGDATNSAFDDDNRAPDEPTRLRWRVASERRTALDRAIAGRRPRRPAASPARHKGHGRDERASGRRRAEHPRLRCARLPAPRRRHEDGMMSAHAFDGAVLKRWIAVRIGGQTHLLGVLIGGHTRLAPGRWVITSPVLAVNPATQVAVTASTGRRYHLLDRLQPPLPPEVVDLVVTAICAWRLPPDTSVEFEL